MPRFNAFERFTHWLTAVSFVVLGIYRAEHHLRKALLLPLIGPDAFSAFSEAAKYAHNFMSFPFVLGLVLIVVIWMKDNIPDKIDIEWFKQGGGFIKSKHRAGAPVQCRREAGVLGAPLAPAPRFRCPAICCCSRSM